MRAFVGVERITTEVCRAWDVGTAPKRATVFRGPALWLAGQLDPIIPLSEIERAAKSVPHSTLIAMPATGHATDASWWSCLDPLIARFLADPGEKLAADGDRRLPRGGRGHPVSHPHGRPNALPPASQGCRALVTRSTFE